MVYFNYEHTPLLLASYRSYTASVRCAPKCFASSVILLNMLKIFSEALDSLSMIAQ